MNKISRQLIKISKQIITAKIDWVAVIKKHLQELKKKKTFNISQFADVIVKHESFVSKNFDQINKILNNDEFKDYHIQIIKDESNKKTIWEDVIRKHLQELKKKKKFNSIKQFADVIDKNKTFVWKNLDQINKILNNDEFKDYNIQIIKNKSNKKTIWEDVIKQYLQELKKKKTFNISQFADVIDKHENFVGKNFDQINKILLNNDEFKNYNIQIIKNESNKKIDWAAVIEKYKSKLQDRTIPLKKFKDIIKKSATAIYKNFEEIKPLLDEIKCTLKYEKSWLQYSFQEAILELDNVVRVDTQVRFDGKNQLADIENLIKKSKNILNKKNLIAKKIKLSTNNDDKESESLDRLTNLLNNLISKLNNIHRDAFDFYVETVNNKYLIQCQGDQHYDFNKSRSQNIIDRILIDSAKMLFAAKHNCNFIATYDVKAKKYAKESLDVFNDFYITTEDAINLIKTEGTTNKRKVKRCAITMINRIRKKFEDRINQLSNKIKKDQIKTNKEILQQIRKY